MVTQAVLLGFGLDLLLGDPAWMPHPVVWMGRAISALEKPLRRAFGPSEAGLLRAGRVLAAVLPLGTLLLTGLVCRAAQALHPALGLLVQTVWCWQALAAKGLYTESTAVQRQLEKQDLPAARRAVSRIVGRDTAALTSEGVAKAAVETVAENFSDGVIAPLLYMLLGGAPLALCYKSINTMTAWWAIKTKSICISGALPPIWTMLPTGCPAAWRRCCGSCAQGCAAKVCGARGAFGGVTAAAMPAPIPRKPNRPARGRWGCSWQARHGISASITRKKPLAMHTARWSPGILPAPTA